MYINMMVVVDKCLNYLYFKKDFNISSSLTCFSACLCAGLLSGRVPAGPVFPGECRLWPSGLQKTGGHLGTLHQRVCLLPGSDHGSQRGTKPHNAHAHVNTHTHRTTNRPNPHETQHLLLCVFCPITEFLSVRFMQKSLRVFHSLEQWIRNWMRAQQIANSLSVFFVAFRCFWLHSQTCIWGIAWLMSTIGGCLLTSMSFAWWDVMQISSVRPAIFKCIM